MAQILNFPNRNPPLNVAVDLLDDILLPNFERDDLADPDDSDLYFCGWTYTKAYIRMLESMVTPEQLLEAHESAEVETIEYAEWRLDDHHQCGEDLDRTPADFLRVWRDYCTPSVR